MADLIVHKKFALAAGLLVCLLVARCNLRSGRPDRLRDLRHSSAANKTKHANEGIATATQAMESVESKANASKVVAALLVSDEIDATDDGRPRHLHLAIIGDSISRFQYMALVHYLHYGVHIRNEDKPKKLSFKDKQLAPGPNDKYHDFSKVLLPGEQCDCYRLKEWKPKVFVDNRYYYDPIRNNSLSFLLKYGHMEAHGHWPPEDVHKAHEMSFEEGNYSWSGNWSVAIGHLAKIRPKPEYVIFNAGHHPHHMRMANVQDDIVQTLNENGFVGIYKSTTCKKGNMMSRTALGRYEDEMCEKMKHRCINYNWTCAFKPEDNVLYYDHTHFVPSVNQRMNEELLEYLQTLSTSKY